MADKENRQVVFLSFADTRMAPTLKRIGREARESGFFDKILCYNEKKLDRKFLCEHKQFFKDYPRGFGLWIWKAYLIKTTLAKLNEGDILVYLDAGCEIHKSGEKRFREYIELLDTYSLLVYDHATSYEYQLSKYDTLAFFDVQDRDDVVNTRQFHGGLQVMRKDEFTVQLMTEWYSIMNEHVHLINDVPSGHAEHPKFQQHCNDQSVFSILCKLRGVTWSRDVVPTGKHIYVLPMGECFPVPEDWESMRPYPFWARHNTTFKGMSLWERFVHRINMVLNR